MVPSGRAARLIFPCYLLRPVASPEAASAEGEAAEWSVMRRRVPLPSTSRSSTLPTCHPRRRHATTSGCWSTVSGARYGSRSRRASPGRLDSSDRGDEDRGVVWEGGVGCVLRSARRRQEDIGTRRKNENTAVMAAFGSASECGALICVVGGNPLHGVMETRRPRLTTRPGLSGCLSVFPTTIGAFAEHLKHGPGCPGSCFEHDASSTPLVESVSVTWE